MGDFILLHLKQYDYQQMYFLIESCIYLVERECHVGSCDGKGSTQKTTPITLWDPVTGSAIENEAHVSLCQILYLGRPLSGPECRFSVGWRCTLTAGPCTERRGP